MLWGFKNTWDDAVAVIDLQRLFLYNKQRIEDEYKIETPSENLNVTIYSRTYSINEDIKKKIFNFKFELWKKLLLF